MSLINELENNGFSVNGKYIYKVSQKTSRKEVCGYYNDNDSAFFYAQNVYPYQSGKIVFSSTNGTVTNHNDLKPIYNIPERVAFTFNEYKSITVKDSSLLTFINNTIGEYNGNQYINTYNIRGVADGYLSNATAFPYINYGGELITAKIIKYDTVKGKRVKSGASTNWLHSYKPSLKRLEKTKGSNSVNCFFGEHLIKDSANPVVIVESEKTACILSMLFPSIDFLATGGLHFFKKQSENIKDILKEKDVFVYADCGVNEWRVISEKYGFVYAEVLDVMHNVNGWVSEGDDVADFIIPILQNDHTHYEAFDVIYKSLESIQEGNSEYNKILSTLEDLQFTVKPNFNKKVAMTISSSDESFIDVNSVIYRWDNSNTIGGAFNEYKYFNIYENQFQVITANVNINSGVWSQKYKRKIDFNKETFVAELKRLFVIIQHLNKGSHTSQDVKDFYRKMLIQVNAFSKYKFNYELLFSEYDDWLNEYNNNINTMLDELAKILGKRRKNLIVKERNWNIKPDVIIQDVKGEDNSFLMRLDEDRKYHRASNIFNGEAIEQLRNNVFIPIHKIDAVLCPKTHKAISNGVKFYNIELTGGYTEPHLNNYKEIKEYLMWCYSNFLSFNQKEYKNEDTLYIDTYMRCPQICTVFLICFTNSKFFPKNIDVLNNTSISNKATIKTILNALTSDLSNTINTAHKIIYLYDNPTSYSISRDGNRINLLPNFENMEEAIEVKNYDEVISNYINNINFTNISNIFDDEVYCEHQIKSVESKFNAEARGKEFYSRWLKAKQPKKGWDSLRFLDSAQYI